MDKETLSDWIYLLNPIFIINTLFNIFETIN